jgi:hypothetical protein
MNIETRLQKLEQAVIDRHLSALPSMVIKYFALTENPTTRRIEAVGEPDLTDDERLLVESGVPVMVFEDVSDDGRV